MLTYRVIKAPEIAIMSVTHGHTMDTKPQVYLAKSEQGVYYTMIYQIQLYVWVLLKASKSCPMQLRGR
jgi:hypothetical protein